jgi:hypothetical protein
MPLCEKHNITTPHKCSLCTVEKRKATMVARYGVENPAHSKEIMDRKNKTLIEKYGTINIFTTDVIKNKIKKGNIEKYGVACTLQLKDIRDKGTATMLEKYGVAHAIQSEKVLQKRVETNIERFGTENALQNPDILAKRRLTNMERYGVNEVLQMPDMQERIRDTMIERYGVGIPLQCQEIKDRRDKTCEERYGDKDIMHNAEIFEKVVKNSFKKKDYKLPSGTMITYQGYENIALDELLKTIKEEDITNDIKIMPKFIYEFEGETHRYYPDIYVPSQKRIIEVKSPYTYKKQLEQNHCKRAQVMKDGYTFEFWICDKKKILEVINTV